jgi:hypothetical protein
MGPYYQCRRVGKKRKIIGKRNKQQATPVVLRRRADSLPTALPL